MDVCVGSGAVDATTENKKPQLEYRLTLKIAIDDPAALWSAAAKQFMDGTELTADDIAETIGPREDPSIEDCLMVVALPTGLSGCRMLDFGIGAVRGERREVPSASDAIAPLLARNPPAYNPLPIGDDCVTTMTWRS